MRDVARLGERDHAAGGIHRQSDVLDTAHGADDVTAHLIQHDRRALTDAVTVAGDRVGRVECVQPRGDIGPAQVQRVGDLAGSVAAEHRGVGDEVVREAAEARASPCRIGLVQHDRCRHLRHARHCGRAVVEDPEAAVGAQVVRRGVAVAVGIGYLLHQRELASGDRQAGGIVCVGSVRVPDIARLAEGDHAAGGIHRQADVLDAVDGTDDVPAHLIEQDRGALAEAVAVSGERVGRIQRVQARSDIGAAQVQRIADRARPVGAEDRGIRDEVIGKAAEAGPHAVRAGLIERDGRRNFRHADLCVGQAVAVIVVPAEAVAVVTDDRHAGDLDRGIFVSTVVVVAAIGVRLIVVIAAVIAVAVLIVVIAVITVGIFHFVFVVGGPGEVEVEGFGALEHHVVVDGNLDCLRTGLGTVRLEREHAAHRLVVAKDQRAGILHQGVGGRDLVPGVVAVRRGVQVQHIALRIGVRERRAVARLVLDRERAVEGAGDRDGERDGARAFVVLDVVDRQAGGCVLRLIVFVALALADVTDGDRLLLDQRGIVARLLSDRPGQPAATGDVGHRLVGQPLQFGNGERVRRAHLSHAILLPERDVRRDLGDRGVQVLGIRIVQTFQPERRGGGIA